MHRRTQLAEISAQIQRGALEEARHGLRNLLNRNPGDGDALHLMGLLCKRAQDFQGALDYMRRSISALPDRADFHGNLGNLHYGLGQYREAEAAYRAALACNRDFRAARIGLARLLTRTARPRDGEAEARVLTGSNAGDAEAWVVLGDALSQQGRHPDAEAAYQRSLQLRPGYGIALHNLGALLAMQRQSERALPLLEQAAASGMGGRELHLNLSRTLFELGRFDEADSALVTALGASPNDTRLHELLCKMRFARGEPEFTRSISEALARDPSRAELHILLADLLWRAGQPERSEPILRDLIGRGNPPAAAVTTLGVVLQAQGRHVESEVLARRAFEADPTNTGLVENLVVALLALGRAEETLAMIQEQRARFPHDQRWLAHLAMASRQLGTAAYSQLYDYARFVRPFDISVPSGWDSIGAFHRDLIAALASRHQLEAHPLDQSLRGGTQTSRSLLTDPDPAIRALLGCLRECVERYRAELGFDPSSPYLEWNRGEVRMSGCWSVRLRRGGYHVNHIHPRGWISSAYYVEVPAEVEDATLRSGWIKFGEPNVPAPASEPAHFVQPRAGQLVLFPSYMWHGTTPILSDQPRVTVAFDVVPTGWGGEQ